MPIFGFVEKHHATYWESVNAGIARSARQFGAEVRILAPQHEDADAQATLARQLLAEGVDGLGIVGTRSGVLDDVVGEAVDMGIPVVTFDLDLPQSRRHLYVGCEDYTELGREAGRMMALGLDPGSRVLVMPGSTVGQGARQKTAGFLEAIADSQLSPVIGEIEEANHDRCFHTVVKLLETEEVSGCFGPYAYHPTIFARAFDHLGLRNRPRVVAFDMIPPTIDLLRAKAISASIWIREYYFGLYACAGLAVLNALGIADGLEFLTGSREAPGKLLMTAATYTPDTVESFVAWRSKALGSP
jgi:ABC-type sugar transport system substrate-binding protein